MVPETVIRAPCVVARRSTGQGLPPPVPPNSRSSGPIVPVSCITWLAAVTSASTCTDEASEPAVSETCGIESVVVRPVIPSCHVTLAPMTCRVWIEKDWPAAALPGLAGAAALAGASCQLPWPRLFVSSSTSGWSSTRRVIATRPCSSAPRPISATIERTVSISGRVAPFMLAKATPETSIVGVV